MENQLVVNRGAKWYQNVGAFTFVDPTTNVAFHPRTAVQVHQSDWMKDQPVIQEMVAEAEPVIQEIVAEAEPAKATTKK